MTASDTAAPDALPPTHPRRLIAVAGLTVLLSELVFLGGAYVQGFSIADRAGLGIANDFVNVWAAGRLVLAADRATHPRLRACTARYRRGNRMTAPLIVHRTG